MAQGLVNIRVNESQLAKIQKLLKNVPKGMPKAMTRGINKTALWARTRIARKVKEKSSLKISDIRSGIRLQKATFSKWSATLNIDDERIPLIKFKAKQSKKKHTFLAGAKQSAWLYYNIFKPKYGPAAAFSMSYRVTRMFPVVTYEMFNQKKEITDAFIGTMPSGHRGIFRRRAFGEGGEGGRHPVYELQGPSVGKLFEGSAGIARRVQVAVGIKLMDNIHTQVGLLLKKRGGGA